MPNEGSMLRQDRAERNLTHAHTRRPIEEKLLGILKFLVWSRQIKPCHHWIDHAFYNFYLQPISHYYNYKHHYNYTEDRTYHIQSGAF